MEDPVAELVREHYEKAGEAERLDSAFGQVEFERTKEILLRALPRPPGTIADVGGGPGRYSTWLAASGYDVLLTDVVPRHIVEAKEAAARDGVRIKAEIGDARSLEIGDASIDAVLLLGPLYHLQERSDRMQALKEARRVLRPEGVVFVSAISRWAARLHGMVVTRAYEEHPETVDLIESVERSGVLPPLSGDDFSGYCHRPSQLRREVRGAGLTVVDLVSVEGIAFALSDLAERMEKPEGRAVVLDAARAIERVPELLGLGPHFLLTAIRSEEGS